jgi:hypothetical protein
MIEDGLHPQYSLASADRAFMRPRVENRVAVDAVHRQLERGGSLLLGVAASFLFRFVPVREAATCRKNFVGHGKPAIGKRSMPKASMTPSLWPSQNASWSITDAAAQ